jgi:hypothetical protein
MNSRGTRALSSPEQAVATTAEAERTAPLPAEWRLPSGQSLVEFALTAGPPATKSAQPDRKPARGRGLKRD